MRVQKDDVTLDMEDFNCAMVVNKTHKLDHVPWKSSLLKHKVKQHILKEHLPSFVVVLFASENKEQSCRLVKFDGNSGEWKPRSGKPVMNHEKGLARYLNAFYIEN